jgi:hypothetical protein
MIHSVSILTDLSSFDPGCSTQLQKVTALATKKGYITAIIIEANCTNYLQRITVLGLFAEKIIDCTCLTWLLYFISYRFRFGDPKVWVARAH